MKKIPRMKGLQLTSEQLEAVMGCGGVGVVSPLHQRQDVVSLMLFTGHSVGHSTVTESCAFYFVSWCLLATSMANIRSWTSAASSPLGKTVVLYQCPHV